MQALTRLRICFQSSSITQITSSVSSLRLLWEEKRQEFSRRLHTFGFSGQNTQIPLHLRQGLHHLVSSYFGFL